MKDCRNCLHCQVNIARKTLRCCFNYWSWHGKGMGVYTLSVHEYGVIHDNVASHIDIKDRGAFKVAESCEHYEGM